VRGTIVGAIISVALSFIIIKVRRAPPVLGWQASARGRSG
jgi:hypothetical protein